MRKVTITVEYSQDLGEYEELDLTVEYDGTEYVYDPFEDEWTWIDDNDNQHIVDKIREEVLLKWLNQFLKEKTEKRMWEDFQENIETQIRETAQVDADIEWDKLTHADYLDTNQKLISLIQEQQATIEGITNTNDFLGETIERYKKEIAQYKERMYTLTSSKK